MNTFPYQLLLLEISSKVINYLERADHGGRVDMGREPGGVYETLMIVKHVHRASER